MAAVMLDRIFLDVASSKVEQTGHHPNRQSRV